MIRFVRSGTNLLLLLLILMTREVIRTSQSSSLSSTSGYYDDDLEDLDPNGAMENDEDDNFYDGLIDVNASANDSQNLDQESRAHTEDGQNKRPSCTKKCGHYHALIKKHRCRSRCPKLFKKRKGDGSHVPSREENNDICFRKMPDDDYRICPIKNKHTSPISILSHFEMEGTDPLTKCTVDSENIVCTTSAPQGFENDIIFIEGGGKGEGEMYFLDFAINSYDCTPTGTRNPTDVTSDVIGSRYNEILLLAWGLPPAGQCLEIKGGCYENYYTEDKKKVDCTTAVNTNIKIGQHYHDNFQACPTGGPLQGAGCPTSGTCTVETAQGEKVTTTCPLEGITPEEGQKGCCDGHFCMPNACCLDEAPISCCKKSTEQGGVPDVPQLSGTSCQEGGGGGVGKGVNQLVPKGSKKGNKGSKGKWKGWNKKKKGGKNKGKNSKWHSAIESRSSPTSFQASEQVVVPEDQSVPEGQEKGDHGILVDSQDEEMVARSAGPGLAQGRSSSYSSSCPKKCVGYRRIMDRCWVKCPGFFKKGKKSREEEEPYVPPSFEKYSVENIVDKAYFSRNQYLNFDGERGRGSSTAVASVFFLEPKGPDKVVVVTYQMSTFDCNIYRSPPETPITPELTLTCPLGTVCMINMPEDYRTVGQKTCQKLVTLGCKVGPSEAEALTEIKCAAALHFGAGGLIKNLAPCPKKGPGCPDLGQCAVEVDEKDATACSPYPYTPLGEGEKECCEGHFCMTNACCQTPESDPIHCCKKAEDDGTISGASEREGCA